MAARFLNYLLTPYLTYILTKEAYGEMSLVYALIPFLNTLFTYGMETTFFRFSNRPEYDKDKVLSTAGLSVFFSTLLLTVLLLVSRDSLVGLLRIGHRPELITWAVWIIAIDAMTTIPFAKLRNDGRPRKYAFVRVSGILVNIASVFFFFSFLPTYAANNPGSFAARWYNPETGVGYVVIANLIQSVFTLLLLVPELLSVKMKWDGVLWKKMMWYAFPVMIAGFGGIINETFDRIMLNWLSTAGSEEAVRGEVGIYSACYKLSILITLFIQAFRMGAEPFFFKQAGGTNAPATYARVMRYFVLATCFMFLLVVLYLDFWKFFIDRKMWGGLDIVPVLLIANICLGIYYNLSIWYKLRNNTRPGAIITFIGAGITILINYLFIPSFGFVACAWATLACYAGMMVISYYWGQRVYPIPYETGLILQYFLLMLGVYFLHTIAIRYTPGWVSGSLFFLLFSGYVLYREREIARQLPVVGRLFR